MPPPALLSTHLAQLEKQGLIRLAQIAPELEYFFRHALVGAAAYGSLLKADRRLIHLHIGEVVEQSPGASAAELAPVLAQHFALAGETERAFQYARLAAQTAQAQYANAEAARFYTAALACLSPDSPQHFDCLAARAEVYNLVAQRADQLADVQAMVTVAQRHNDPTRLCEAHLAFAEYHLNTDPRHVAERATQALHLARELGDRGREGRALRYLGSAAWAQRQLEHCRAPLEQAAAILQTAGLFADAAACLSDLALVLTDLNDPAAESVAHEAVRLSRAARNIRLEALAQRRLTLIYFNQHRHAEGATLNEAVLTMHRQLGDRLGECNALNLTGSLHSALGHLDLAEHYYCAALALAEEIQFTTAAWQILYNLATDVFWRPGEYEKAARVFQNLQTHAWWQANPTLRWRCGDFLMLFLNELGQYAAALAVARQLLPLAPILKREDVTVYLYCAICYAHAYQGDFTAARHALQEARATPPTRLGSRQAILRAQATLAVLTDDVAALRALQAPLAEALHEARAIADVNASNWILYLRLRQAQTALAMARHAPAEPAWPRQALEAAAEAVQHWDRLWAESDLHLYQLEQFLWAYARALQLNRREAEARPVIERAAARVQQVADRIRDAAWRHHWLTQVRDNPAILAGNPASAQSLVSDKIASL